MEVISKEQFVKCIDFIIKRSEAQEKINELFTNEFEDAIFYPYFKYETAYVDLLELIFNDTENNWISYFIYELDFGRKWKPGMVTDDFGDVPMSSAEELYDFLINKEETNKCMQK